MIIKRLVRLGVLGLALAGLAPASFAADAASQIRMADDSGQNFQTVGASASSAEIRISLLDDSRELAVSTSVITVNFSAFHNGNPVSIGTLGSDVLMSTDNFAGAVSTLTIAVGQSQSSKFKIKTSLTGFVTLMAAEASEFEDGLNQSFYTFEVLAAGAGFTNVSVRTDSQPAATLGQTHVTITPNRDGTDDAAVFSFTPPSSNSGWEILIATDTNFTAASIVRQFGGFGEFPMYWYGEDQSGRPVPNGTYPVRLRASGGGITNDTLSVTVQSSFIKGKFLASNEPVEGVNVNVFGPGGGGFARSDSDGNFYVAGLSEGQRYTLEASISGYASVRRENIAANTTLEPITLEQGAAISVSGVIASTSAYDIWGHVFVHDDSFSSTGFGSIHLTPGTTTIDNGFPVGDPARTTYTVVNVLPNKEYKVEVDMRDYGRQSTTINTGDSGTTIPISFEFSRRAIVSGNISLPGPLVTPYGGEWVSVDAIKEGEQFPSAWGGAFIPDAPSPSGTYQVAGLGNGNYTLRAFARGFKTQTKTVTVSGDTTADFPVFSAGGKIIGTVTLIGDSSSLERNNFFTGGTSCSVGQVPIFLNAWSPSTFNGSFTQVCIATNTTQTSAAYEMKGLDDGTYEMYTFLSGFQLDPPGPQRASVSNGLGQKDITFRALSGAIQLNITGVDLGASPVSYSYNGQGPNAGSGQSTTNSSPVVLSGLGTGLYQLNLTRSDTGLQKQAAVAVTNGRTSSLTVPMSENTFSISGTVSLQGSLVLPSTWSVTVSSAAGLRAAAPPAPVVQVFSFPLGSGEPIRSSSAAVSGTNATFSISGLTSGAYLVRVQEDLNTSGGSVGCPGCGGEPGLPELATTNEVVFLNGAGVSDVKVTVSNGAELSGTISRPSDDTTTDARSFSLYLRREDNLTVWKTTTATTSATATYSFPHLSAGNYILEVREEATVPKYAAQPRRITIAASAVTQNITLVKAGAVVGKLRDADSNTLLTEKNVSQFLSNGFGIFAQANPWVSGGFAEADRGNSGYPNISTTTGQFIIYRLIPGTSYDVSFRGFQGLNQEAFAKGQKAYAPVVKSGVQVSEGQTVDVGVVDLKQGVSLSGQVKDAAGTPLPNIPVAGVPSVGNGGDRHSFSVDTFTDAEGRYTLQGIDRGQRYYDVIAAPRFSAGSLFSQLSGKQYGEEKIQMVDVTDPEKRTGVDFQLTEADGVLTGQVVTADGGHLEMPFGDNRGGFADRRAVVVLHKEGVALDDNPLGEIEEVTDAQGRFRITALTPGSYIVRIVSVGYVTAKKIVVVASGVNDMGTVTLQKGATVSGTITKPDGSNPNSSEVGFIVGVDEDFDEFVFGRVDSNSDTKLVTGYSLTGFKTGVTYSIVIGSDETGDLQEGKSGLTFSSTSEKKTVNLVFRPARPAVFATQSRVGNVYTLRFFSTHKLRNLTTDDNDLDKIVTLTAGAGAITSREITSSRDTILVTYNAPANEKSFKIKLAFTSIQTDPDSATGANFTFNKEFKFFAGAGRMRIVHIPNATGGSCSLEGVVAGLNAPPGTFDVDRSSRVEVGVVSATDLDDLSNTAAPRAGPAARAQSVLAAAQRLGPEAYPAPELFAAVQQAPSVSPFSAFYDVFLPAGVSHSLKKEALLTLQYDASVTDPSDINIYYFDPNNNVFLLEKSKRKIDAKNRTITVAVNHASTFVVLNNNAPIVGANTYAGTEIFVHNFPNPFNLKPKTVTLNNASPVASRTIDGTMIKYGLPAGKSGTVRIEIYNVAGELVRTITETAPAGATFYYTPWDGRNDGGKKVASGVYVGRLTVNGGDEKFFKLAVVK